MKRIRLLVVSAGFLPAEAHGGVPYSSFHLASAIAQSPMMEVKVVTSDRNGRGRLAVPTDSWTRYENLPVAYCKTWRGSYMYAPRMSYFLAQAIDWADVVISSGTLWDHSGFLADYYCAQMSKPHLVYPRGLLNGWALNHKKLKKRIGMWVQGRRILERASCVVALSAAEESSVRALAIATPVAIIPNGAPAKPTYASSDLAVSARAGLPTVPYLLFIGRINSNKGLAQAFAAFRQALDAIPSMAFVVAGPVDADYASEFDRLCSSFRSEQLTVTGAVSGVRKHALLEGAQGFVLTSGGEGVPMAVLEAMQYGLPVVITPECNVAGVKEREAGWVVPLGDTAATAAALVRLFGDEVERRRRGLQAQLLAREAYSWEHIAMATQRLLLSQHSAQT